MLIVTGVELLNNLQGFTVYNVSSMYEGIPRLNILPTAMINCGDEKMFDMSYANYILENDAIFSEMMKIMYSLYMNENVALLVTRNPVLDVITESLLKLIQQRYGYSAYLINCIEDLEYVNIDFSFSLAGLYNFDIDKERFVVLNPQLFIGDVNDEQ